MDSRTSFRRTKQNRSKIVRIAQFSIYGSKTIKRANTQLHVCQEFQLLSDYLLLVSNRLQEATAAGLPSAPCAGRLYRFQLPVDRCSQFVEYPFG